MAAYIHGPLLYIGEFRPFPTSQSDHLKHLDKRLLDPSNIEAIRCYLSKREEKVRQWTRESWDELLSLPG